MAYNLNVDAVRAKLARLSMLARQQPSGPESQLTGEFTTLLAEIQRELYNAGDAHYYLAHELQTATYRWVISDPFSITKRAQHQIRCQYQPALFADFLDALLDDDLRAQRIRRAGSAGGYGYDPTGLTLEEMKEMERRCMDADMAAFDERDEELALDRLYD